MKADGGAGHRRGDARRDGTAAMESAFVKADGASGFELGIKHGAAAMESAFVKADGGSSNSLLLTSGNRGAFERCVRNRVAVRNYSVVKEQSARSGTEMRAPPQSRGAT